MKIRNKKIKVINIPAQKEKFREAFRHKFKGFLSKNPLMWVGDVIVGAGFMLWHAPATPLLNCLLIGGAMTVGGAAGGIPLAFAGGLAGGWLGRKFGKTPKAIKVHAIAGSFTLGIFGIVAGNIAGYKLTRQFLVKGETKDLFNRKADSIAPAADGKTYTVTPDDFRRAAR